MTDCEYKGWCRLECPLDQLDCKTYIYYQENQDEIDMMLTRQSYKSLKLKHVFRNEQIRRKGEMT